MADPKYERNLALNLHSDGQLLIEEVPLKLPHGIPDGHVIVEMRATGICGSDVHFVDDRQTMPSRFSGTPNYILGHECAGEVVDVARNVTGWTNGSRVAIKPGSYCRKRAMPPLPTLARHAANTDCLRDRCFDCTTGQHNLCANQTYFGVSPWDGSCCTWKLVPEEQLAELTPKISWVEAGLIQPLAITLQMARQAGLRAHQNVMIFGAGCIGLQLGAVAKAYGAANVVILEKVQDRAEFARTYCANYTFVNPQRTSDDEKDPFHYPRRVSKDILAKVPGLNRGFNVCIEASGAEECMQMGIFLCRPGGTYVQVGLPTNPGPQFPIDEIIRKQVNIKGTLRYTTNCFEEAISMIDRGLIDMKTLVTHTYPFSDALDAIETARKFKDKSGRKSRKVVILHGT